MIYQWFKLYQWWCEIWKFYSNIYPEELQLGKENTDKYEASFLDLDIKIKDGKFYFGFMDKRDSFPFSIVRMPDEPGNVSSTGV